MLRGGKGDDLLYGGDGKDVLKGGKDNDLLYGERGQDELRGGQGDDRLIGEDGNDVLYGGAGDDVLYGGNDADILYGGQGNDVLNGGNDAADILYGGQGDDVLSSGSILYGDLGDDTLYAGVRTNAVFGGDGDDALYSEGVYSDDSFVRADLYGGSGADTFHFSQLDGLHAYEGYCSTIFDFSQAEGDKISLKSNTSLTFIGDAEFSGSAGEVRFEHEDSATFVYADLDGNGTHDGGFKIEGTVALQVDDFVV